MDLSLERYKHNINKLKEEYPNFKVWSDHYALSFYDQILSEQVISEFVTKTIDVDKTLQELDKRFDLKFPKAKVEQGRDFIKITFEKGQFGNTFNIIDDILNFMDSFGWFPSKIDGMKFNNKTFLNKKSNQTQLNILFEPKFDTEIKPQKYHYHLTPDIYWENKIEDMGLTPKNKSKISTHPERIYLLKEYNKNEFKRLARNLFLSISNPKIKQRIYKYYVLEIDVKELINNRGVKFYKDPNYSLGVWTYEVIPPIYIKIIDQIPLETLKDYI
jgi:hypothetical protein